MTERRRQPPRAEPAPERSRVEPTIEELESDLAISKSSDDLEEECRFQPELFWQVSKQLSLAISRRDAAKLDVKDAEAGVKDAEARADAQIRHDAEVADEKITEKQVESLKREHREVRTALSAARAANATVIDLDYQVGLLFGLKDSFSQRNDALERLVKLFLQGQYGDSAIDRAGRPMRAAAGEAAKEARRERYNRR